MADLKIEKLTLEDGRHAERHTSLDTSGNEVVEIFAEEKRPLKLEKRIVREFKNVLAKETHQTIKEGEIAQEEVHANEMAEMPLKIVQKLGTPDHDRVVDGDYVKREEIGNIVAESVVAGISALMENMKHVPQAELSEIHAETAVPSVAKAIAPVMNAFSVVENNVQQKKKGNMTNIIILVGILVVQVAISGYIMIVMR